MNTSALKRFATNFPAPIITTSTGLRMLLFAAATLGLAVATASSLQAHDERFERHLNHRLERMSDQLGLDEQQVEELRAIFVEANERRSALRDSAEQQLKPEVCAIHQDTMNQVRQVLSEAQAAELEQLSQDRDLRDERGRGGPAGTERRERFERLLETC